MSEFLDRSPGLHADEPAAASPQGLVDRKELASVAVERTRMPMVVTDPRQPDNPIVLANQAFLQLTGYSAEEVIGRNCRMLQGTDTSVEAVAAIRRGLVDERVIDVELLNYRKDGSAFWNRLHIDPIHDEQGNLLYFFASQMDSTENRALRELEASEYRLLREVDHRSLNVLAIVNGIVRLTKANDTAAYAASVERRVQALARAHVILAERGWTQVPLGQLIEEQMKLYDAGRFQLSGPPVAMPGAVVQSLALVFHELAANAAQHGAWSLPQGRVQVAWSPVPDSNAVALDWEESGGPEPLTDPERGFGATMINAIVRRQLKGHVDLQWEPKGLKAHLVIPLAAAA